MSAESVSHRSSGRAIGTASIISVLLAIFLLAGFIRFWFLDAAELWFDENCTFYIVHHLSDWPEEGPPFQREVGHIPYFAVLHLWTRLTGETIFGMRSFSALVGVMNVIAMAWMGWKWGGRRYAVIAAAMIAVHPLHVHYSQEARSYAMWMLTVTIGIYCLDRAARTLQTRWWIGYVIIGWLAFLTHYYTLVWFPGTIAAVFLTEDRRRFQRQWLMANAVLGLLCVPVIWWLVVPLASGGAKPWFLDLWMEYPPALVIPKSFWAMLPSGGYPYWVPPLNHVPRLLSTKLGIDVGAILRWGPAVIVAVLNAVILLRWHQKRALQSIRTIGERELHAVPDSAFPLDARRLAFLSCLTMCYLAGAFLHSCLLEPTYVVARYDLAAWPSIFWAIVLLVDCATTGMRSHRARVFSRTAIVAALCLCSSAVTLGVHLVPVPNRHLRLARMIARTVGQNDLVISVAKYELFMLHEWHRLGFSAEVISFPPQHDRQLCWYDSLAELSNLEEIERGVETVTQRIERAFLEGCRVWLVATGKTEGPRWEVDRRLFQRLQELEIDVQPVDDDSGLAELRRLSNHPAGSTSN